MDRDSYVDYADTEHHTQRSVFPSHLMFKYSTFTLNFIYFIVKIEMEKDLNSRFMFNVRIVRLTRFSLHLTLSPESRVLPKISVRSLDKYSIKPIASYLCDEFYRIVTYNRAHFTACRSFYYFVCMFYYLVRVSNT